MKNIFLFLVVLMFAVDAHSQSYWGSGQGSLTTTKKATIKFDRTTADLGEIKYNQPVEVRFKLTNTGDKPVIITKAEGSCGCTDINYSKKPILPGQSDIISVIYDAATLGTFHKTVTLHLTLDAPYNTQQLFITGKVIK